jgi:hypothetical protein
VWEINQHMAEARGAAPTMDDMPPEEAPEVSGILLFVSQHRLQDNGWVLSCLQSHTRFFLLDC